MKAERHCPVIWSYNISPSCDSKTMINVYDAALRLRFVVGALVRISKDSWHFRDFRENPE